jgi:hypothetical protein
MNDDDNLYFSFDDEEAADETPEAEEGQNRSFLIGALVLAAVFVLGICAVLLYLFVYRPSQVAGGSDIALTNAANMTAYAITQTAQSQAQTGVTQPAGTQETTQPAVTTVEPSATPTLEVDLTLTVEQATGEATEATAEATTEGTQVAEVTPVGGTASPTPLKPATTPGVTPTSGIIEVTPLGGATPTRIAGGTTGGTTGGIGGAATPTGVGGPIQPTSQATLPATGFGGGGGLAGAGLLALALVAVVVIVRNMRAK